MRRQEGGKGVGRGGWVADVRMDGPRDGEWSFELSDRMHGVQDELYDIADSMVSSPSRAERKLRRIIEHEPYAFDAYHQLAFIHWYVYREPREALAILEMGLSRAEELFPEGFKLGERRLPWLVLENRPFLRMYESLGSRYLELGELERATKVFENIIAMNPDDNQGIRETLCECYFSRGNPASVLKLCDNYRDDGMPAILYGRVLALLKLGGVREARKELEEALVYGENIAIELMRKKHRHLKPDDDLRPIESGSRFEAELYWSHFGRFWEETGGGVEFVRSVATRE